MKFIFAKKPDEASAKQELTAEDHPALFDMIQSVARELEAPLPNQVFLVPEMNAAVSIKPHFLGPLFSGQKDLIIGAPLVEVLTTSQFKAVLAHEFGHFSQKSLKMARYVSAVNQAIYNLTFEYDAWDQTLQSWQDTGNYLVMFIARLIYNIVSAIRSLLRWAYSWINAAHAKLSRQMEFHADLFAGYIAGTDSMIQGLRVLEVGSIAHEFATSRSNSRAMEQQRVKNLTNAFRVGWDHFLQLNEIEQTQGVVTISDELLDSKTFQKRLNLEDPWASHPSRTDREKNLLEHFTERTIDNRSPWLLFRQPSPLQEALTAQQYDLAFQDAEFEWKWEADSTWVDAWKAESEGAKLPTIFGEYFDNRYVNAFPWEEIEHDPSVEQSVASLFSRNIQDLTRKLVSDQEDLDILNQINTGNLKIRHFHFDDVRYKASDTPDLIGGLTREIEALNEQIRQWDREAWQFMYQRSNEAGQINTFQATYEKWSRHQHHSYLLEVLSGQFGLYIQQVSSVRLWGADEFEHAQSGLLELERHLKNLLKELDWETINEHLDAQDQKFWQEYVKQDRWVGANESLDMDDIIRLLEGILQLHRVEQQIFQSEFQNMLMQQAAHLEA
ncbi:M48 family metallopeptidase [Pontibacter sp. G13]|uniref:M48 family metallopeptidase n=1 Tax=Pontibacter sp. G13 TaxID=3074898 RepID=UPI00288A3124|nr:M48 family metallopeptidase [Pontibacter sp. G13]WNJ20927.1 M48 family metallopeptidase [Pontibacter sp. G13]